MKSSVICLDILIFCAFVSNLFLSCFPTIKSFDPYFWFPWWTWPAGNRSVGVAVRWRPSAPRFHTWSQWPVELYRRLWPILQKKIKSLYSVKVSLNHPFAISITFNKNIIFSFIICIYNIFSEYYIPVVLSYILSIFSQEILAKRITQNKH